MREGVGLVIGSRVFGGSTNILTSARSETLLLSGALGLSVGRYLSDALNGYKLFRRDVFTSFEYTSRMFEIEIEIIANAMRKGYRVVEVVSHERRAGGEMKSRVVRHGTRFLMRIIWEGIRGVKPCAACGFPRSGCGKSTIDQARQEAAKLFLSGPREIQ